MASLHTQGQSHDRIVTPSGNGALDMPAEPNLIGKPVEVTTSITQKMLSATTGSLLTSLLGMFGASPARRSIFLRF
jgi:solute carrier family 25 protein 39/40